MFTTVSSIEKARAATEAGADAVIRSDVDDVASAIAELTGGVGVQRIIEVALGASFELDAGLIAESGVIAAYGSPGNFTPPFPMLPLIFRRAVVRLVNGFALDDAALADITRALDERVLAAAIWKSFPLERIAEAHCRCRRASSDWQSRPPHRSTLNQERERP